MSIILKGNNISSSDKGIGPSEVTNIKASQNASSIILSWTNPSNVVINGTTLSTFDHVIVVKNASQVPSSEKDGTVIYNGNSTTCTDSSVTKNNKYYYRFFVYDTNKLCNNGISMIIESTFYGYDSILSNNSWNQIAAASEAGIASSLWNIGDEIDITLSGTYNETITLQIWDFDHFDKTDGSGKAGICFGMKNLMKDTQQMGSFITRQLPWNTCEGRSKISKILNSIPDDLQNNIKKVFTYANPFSGNSSSHVGRECQDTIFVPGFTEVFGLNVWSDQSNTEQNQKQFPIFTDDNSRIKKLSNGADSVNIWWTRSPYYYLSDSYFCSVSSDASASRYLDTSALGVCFCFNV